MDHDSRGVSAALVRVPEFDAAAAYERRLVHGQSLLESASELARRHLTHRRFIRPHYRLHDLTDAGAVSRRNEVQRRERHEIELESQLAVDGLPLVERNAVPLVYRDDERAAALERDAQHT